MRSATDKVSSYASLCLLGSFLEMLVPKPLPFFRLGLANIPVMLALPRLGFRDFVLLLLLKATASSYISGTIFSYFFLMSLAQSLASGLTMYAVGRADGKHISLYGISLSGALAGTLAQVAMAMLYLGRGMTVLLAPMLFSSFAFALVTAYLAGSLPDPEMEESPDPGAGTTGGTAGRAVAAAALLSVLMVQIADDAAALAVLFAILAALLPLYGRKIRIRPYLALFAVSLLSNLMTGRGMVVATLLGFEITADSLKAGLETALRLSCTVELSLLFSGLAAPSGLMGRTLSKFFFLEEVFESSEGSLRERIARVLSGTIGEKHPTARDGAVMKAVPPLLACTVCLAYSFLR